MIIDVLIVLFAISALYRGREIGFVRQLFSTVGFFAGLFLGAFVQPHTVGWVQGSNNRAIVTLLTTLGCALVLLAIGEYVGIKLKHKVLLKRINRIDNGLGSLLSVVSLLFSIWLTSAIINSLPVPNIQAALQGSRIVSALNRELPQAPTLIADLGHLIDPNGFPQVFAGHEPNPRSGITLPNLGDLQAAVTRDKESVVKVEGQGCGGVVEGSGFVAGSGLVATNAHVIAGIKRPFVQDSSGIHSATPIWFDPDLDFAVLRVSNLAGHSLVISSATVKSGTAAAVLGYPGGGSFTADPAAVLDQFTASGRNIYGRGQVHRDVYEVQADIIPGNSGGPLVARDGSVIGLIFAQSTTYEHVGYALTASQVSTELDQAVARNQTVNTGACAE
ncbi:MAG: serine protease [Candidatus Saccharibacteria bacterium]|nr:serine protease [Candidatus Saccharibacteria bacterium]